MKVLRAVLSIASVSLASAIGAATAVGQTTTLTINAATASDNSATVNVAAGTTMTIVVSNPAMPNRPYGVFAALANNGSTSGWYLAASGPKNPFPVITGVPTAFVEADYGIDIVPDRSGNPGLRLNSSGTVTLSLRLSNSISGTMYFQAVSLASGTTTTDFSNAIAVTFVASANSGRLLVSQSTVDQDNVQFGVLEWTGGDPRTATFTQPDATLADIKPDNIFLGDLNDWNTHFGALADRARDVDWRTPIFGPSVNNDNQEYARISLEALPGSDGLFGTADDIPPRDLMRCYDDVTDEGFFLVINKGANPLVPGTDFYPIPGTRMKDSVSPILNSWKGGIQVSPDGSRAAAIYDDSSVAVGKEPKIFLFATDCSKPYLDSLNVATDILDVTPAGTTAFNTLNTARTSVFTNNRLWFTNGTTAAANMKLWTVDIRVTKPAPSQVTINTNANYTSPVIDTIPEKCMLVPRQGGTTMCFLAGDTFSVGPPEHMLKADWYAVTEAKPTQAVNLSKFDEYGATGTTVPKMVIPGDPWNGSVGFASMSPDGTKLAFVSLNSKENGTASGEDDEIYLVSTLDSDGNNEGDDAGTIFDFPVTSNARINSSNIAPGNINFDNSRDLYLSDANNLYFFYGAETSASIRGYDLFHWNNTSLVMLDVTTPAKVAPFTTTGTISPEGIFLSPNLRYLYFSRGIDNATKTNLVGVDTTTQKAFNITGNEYPGSTITDVNNTGAIGENFNWHLSYAGGSNPSLVFFSAPIVTGGVTNLASNIFAFDANFPTAAIQLTFDNPGVVENVDSLTGNPYGLGCVWAWERSTSANADYEYQDLLFFFRDVLSDTAVSFNSSVTLAGFDWIRAATSNDPTGAAPAGLICSIGDTGTDQASDAEFYYFSLNGTTNYDFDSTVGNDAPGHQVGTTALAGLPFSGFIQIYHADVD